MNHPATISAKSGFLTLAFCLLMTGGTCLRAETPVAAVDRLWNAAFDEKGQFYSAPGIWKLSKIIAQEQGVAVIPPIMARSKDWKSEEILVFIPVVYLLPPDKTVPILKKFQETGKPWEQQCAKDLLIEITEHAGDLKDMEKQAANE